MTRNELAALIDQYGAGLEAELQLLGHLMRAAAEQRDVSAACDYKALQVATDTRERLTRTLVALEGELRGIRSTLSMNKADARRIPTFEAVVALHNRAADLVAEILAADKASLEALQNAEVGRRAAMVSLQHGENTMAAYRKVLSPPVLAASLVDRRG